MEPIASRHGAAELAALSTFVHNLAGGLLVALALASLAELLRGLSQGRGRYAWPALGAVVGYGLAAFVVWHARFVHRTGVFDDPAQVQHLAIGLLLGAGASVELVRRRRGATGRGWRLGWPLALVGVGLAFVLHEQGTPEARLVHWALAASIILAGLVEAATALSGEDALSMRVFAVLVLLAAALQLVFYREAPGAHGAHAPAAAPAVEDPHAGHR